MAQKTICIDSREFNISYIISRNVKNTNKWTIFLHGWGANKELMQHCFDKYFVDYNHLYIDLPGFGNSSNDYILCTKDYARIIGAFLQILDITPHMIIGHSFGGKVAVLLNPAILILLSNAGIPKIKNIKVKIKIKLAKICKFFHIKSTIFRSKDASNMPENMYETLKLVVDEDFSDIFSAFSGKTFIFWGKDDDTTPLYMAERISSLMKDSSLYKLEGNHFFFLNNAKMIDRIVNGK